MLRAMKHAARALLGRSWIPIALCALVFGCSRDPAAPAPSASAPAGAPPVSVAPRPSASSAARGGPAVGDAAPDFELAGSDGKTHKLSEHRGKEAVVIAWFPKAFTGG